MKFSDSHEWVAKENEDICRVGITSFAQKELGDIVYVEVPKIGKEIRAKQEVAVLESTKAAADVYSPVSGTILEVNTQLKDNPEFINQSPEEKGWLYTIRISHPQELDELMDKKEYDSMVSGK